ncbi:MAG: hypothetical protein PHX61_03195 [Alphaproteobacteria bacterium]|nr:hypothetical protein [Alphaproteobacteria bacterium]
MVSLSKILMRKKIFLSVLVVVAAIWILVQGSLAQSETVPQSKDDIVLIEGKLGDKKLFIPKAYFKPGFANFNEQTISLQMVQPEFLPLMKSQSQMWNDGEQTKYLSVLVHHGDYSIDFSKHIQERVSFLEAFEAVGNEYGLIHLTQPKGYVQDNWDVWVERNGNENISYITCSEKIIKEDVPQCLHEIKSNGYYITVSYDKRNLSHWKQIENGVLSVFQSFETADTSRQSLYSKYQQLIEGQGE